LDPSSFSWNVRFGEGTVRIVAGIAVGMATVGISFEEEAAISNE
jgi:hypothetical protein